MSTWAPVVYAPTFKVDFRLIAAPSALAQGSGRNWLASFILPVLDGSEQFDKSSHWALFQSETWRVFGVGCRASSLVQRNETRVSDDHARPLSLFVGYAAQKTSNDGFPHPLMCDTSLDPFTALYVDFVLKRHWGDMRPGAIDKVDQYSVAFRTNLRPNVNNLAMLNTDSHKIALWPDTKIDRARLWQAMSASLAPLSVMLGFAHTRHACNAPYLNGTAQDVKSANVFSK